jgi:excinuclease UvrABC nuclease subunit
MNTCPWSIGNNTLDFTDYDTNTTWNDVAGVYIFCGVNQANQWVPLYIGQADSFRNRIPRHEQWLPATRLGATHVHALVVPLAANRDLIERQLIQLYQPPLNQQLR